MLELFEQLELIEEVLLAGERQDDAVAAMAMRRRLRQKRGKSPPGPNQRDKL